MTTKIYVPPKEVAKFCRENKERLTKEMVLIAENTATKYGLYLTIDHDFYVLSVAKGDNAAEYREVCGDEKTSGSIAQKLIARYLVPLTVIDGSAVVPDGIDGTDKVDEGDMDDLIYERDDELQLAMGDLLSVVLQEGRDATDIEELYGLELIDEILDDFLTYLTDIQGFKIYRPSIVTDDDTGDTVFTEFPYETSERFDETEDDDAECEKTTKTP